MSSKTMLDGVEEYTVAWIAALPHERAAGIMMLDEKHDQPKDFSKNVNDPNSYTWGRIGKHHVVIASLPAGEYGTTSAAVTAQGLRSSLPHIRIGLLVGIGAGIPGRKRDADGNMIARHDVRLGDVVVSNPDGTNGGVVQYDFVKAKETLERKGFLNSPPQALRSALSAWQAEHELEDSKIMEIAASAMKKYPKAAITFRRPGMDMDQLYHTSYNHSGGEDCRNCLDSELVKRPSREKPEVHCGTIASGNSLVKNSSYRDELINQLKAENLDPICFEMEAAGLMNTFPCLVIRGICDYGDSHKNDAWQRYAAVTAAAFAKELLEFVNVEEVNRLPKLEKLLSNIDQEVTEVLSTSQKTHATLERLTAELDRNTMYKWLSPADPSTNFNKAQRQRHKGSGIWFLESMVYRQCKRWPNSFLWLHGIPGCGKTILSSTIIEDIRKSGPPSRALLYFYFDFNDRAKQSLDDMMRTLISQLYDQGDYTKKKLDLLFMACEHGREQPALEQMIKTLRGMLRQIGEVTIVLDALDESRMRKELLDWIKDLATDKLINTHLIVTARKEAEIVSAFEQWVDAKNIVPILQNAVDHDIRAYVRTMVRQNDDFKRWRRRPAVQEEIETMLMEKAGGMFRWAACQLETLKECLDLPSLRRQLVALPKTLDETYCRILFSIPNANQQQAITILQFLMFSERPLKLEIAVDAITVDLEAKPAFDETHRMPLPEEILRICSTLVTLVTWNRFDGQLVQELQLAHFSVKEYLQSDRVQGIFGERLSEISSRVSIAKICLSYLRHLRIGLPQWQIEREFPLAQYSARYWYVHARKVEGEDQDLRRAISSFLLDEKDAYATCLGLHNPDSDEQYSSGIAQKYNMVAPLYYTTLIDSHSVPAILDEDANSSLMCRGAKRYNMVVPLYYVSLVGLDYSVRVLLEKDANANVMGGKYGNPLQAAIAGGHANIVQMLVNSGANVNVPSQGYGSPLEAASRAGNGRVVQILIDGGAKINAKYWSEGSRHDFGSSPLMQATDLGHEAVTKVLLDKGAKIDWRDIYGNNTLHTAVHHGREAIAKLLLDKGANVQSIDDSGDTPLQIAVSYGDEAMAKLLLNKEANVESKSDSGNTPLQIAVRHESEAMVKLLLDKGAAVDVKSLSAGRTPLLEAAQLGHMAIVKLLLDKGANVDAKQGSTGLTPLLEAAQRGYFAIVKILLDKGANVELEDHCGATPLFVATMGGYQAMINLLLEYGAMDLRSSIFSVRVESCYDSFHVLITPERTGRQLKNIIGRKMTTYVLDDQLITDGREILDDTILGECLKEGSIIRIHRMPSSGDFGILSDTSDIEVTVGSDED